MYSASISQLSSEGSAGFQARETPSGLEFTLSESPFDLARTRDSRRVYLSQKSSSNDGVSREQRKEGVLRSARTLFAISKILAHLQAKIAICGGLEPELHARRSVRLHHDVDLEVNLSDGSTLLEILRDQGLGLYRRKKSLPLAPSQSLGLYRRVRSHDELQVGKSYRILTGNPKLYSYIDVFFKTENRETKSTTVVWASRAGLCTLVVPDFYFSEQSVFLNGQELRLRNPVIGVAIKYHSQRKSARSVPDFALWRSQRDETFWQQFGRIVRA